jgi:hypothetical protein
MSFNIRARVAIAAAIVAAPVWAHHSHGNYAKEFMDIEGVVTEVALVNPHSWVFIDVTDANGQTTEWALEATNPRALAQLGINDEYIGPGDSIKARCHPLRDGGPGCLLGFLQARDGSIIDWDGHDAKPEDDGFFDMAQ